MCGIIIFRNYTGLYVSLLSIRKLRNIIGGGGMYMYTSCTPKKYIGYLIEVAVQDIVCIYKIPALC